MLSKRVVIREKEDVVIEETPLEPLLNGECRIQTAYSLISAGTELSRVFRLKEGISYPAYPGYCSTGIVLESGIDGFQAGDHVLFSGPHASLHNCNCAAGNEIDGEVHDSVLGSNIIIEEGSFSYEEKE